MSLKTVSNNQNPQINFKQKNGVQPEKKGEHSGVNTFVLLFVVIIIAAIMTYIIPAGNFDRAEINGKSVVQPGTFHYIESSPVGVLDLVTGIHGGMVAAGGVIFFVFVMGGVFGILKATGAIDALILMLSSKFGSREKIIIPILVLFFALMGALKGAAESNLVYVPILIPLAIALGFDTVTGIAIILVGASVGFTAAVMNPFTIGVAQEMADLPTFSGMGLRLILLVILYLLATIFIYRYAMKVKKNPDIGIYGSYNRDVENNTPIYTKMERKHKLVLFTFLLNFIVLIYGVVKYDWFIKDIAGLFLLFGIIIGFLGKLSPNSIANNFMLGAKSLVEGALIIGVARAILVVLEQGQIMDTLLFHAGNVIGHIPPVFTALGMFSLQLIMDFFVPSGSGKAALTMPIMIPLSDLVGITRQTTVLAFQFGDGITNLFFPTSGYLMAALSIAGIGYSKWIKWIMPFIIVQVIIAIITLIIAQIIQYGPF